MMRIQSCIRNERGLTLLELMAALLITSVILGGALSFWWSLQTNSNMTAAAQMQETSVRWTSKQFHHLISEASLAALVSPQEIRLRVGNDYRAIIHHSSKEEWNVYSFSVPPGLSDEAAISQLAAASVTFESNPDRYRYQYSLAHDMPAAPRIRIVQLPDGTAVNTATLPAIAQAGSLLEAELEFQSIGRDSMGRPELTSGNASSRYTLTAKLMKDR
ncbi:PilW family protein [Paenibacillus apiarius]|uniref:Prepilin-type N-terminal cleavage/methylation domain-containing protein n=1 Tax=Paenibacillus apiarius TaxID=46240 RepID=A0ABT4DM83_9BACL|nr:prepilin-type N-terminal cleavage/methylation domain-containing protein [Paenibacillus apiarius]MCY9516079.1 prepilin-type N-terminal cleavage/methylation domain-containing protein [Paenibacillus apiarius]MCY9518462.1 prepilin-type N-terminal cleavage/methylation domain-containing protein [Paenibacillus apiarius]MCY9551137.1 prepilin-type N-terminal cleavage/methylation domain-containing protein [Paenibacillus apiarius]MCY9558291.1 prepilin-type N-terminal cleavage/methylation domain-contain